MNRYIFISVVFIALGLGLVLLPEKAEKSGLRPDLLLLETNSSDRYLSTDVIAARLIDRDPRVLLIDVRKADEFDNYHIPGAVNIPLNLLSQDSVIFSLNLPTKDVVFYSNSSLTADQAWLICRMNNFRHIYVMEGGLNKWFDEIMQPKPARETDDSEARDLYEFRLGASVFFGMPSPKVEYKESVAPEVKAIATPEPAKKEVVEPAKPKKEEAEEEGC